jgi:hypothetical protein
VRGQTAVRLIEGKTSVFRHRTGRWSEIRGSAAMRTRLRLRAEKRQDEAETEGYLGNVGLILILRSDRAPLCRSMVGHRADGISIEAHTMPTAADRESISARSGHSRFR